jgi:mannose-6-phosphate isomerase-like protein (cupin superfamily)
MAIVRKSEAPVFQLPGLTVVGLASPKRGATETCVWQITVAPGTGGLPHRVTREEVFVAVAGTARASLDGQDHDLCAGDALLVPANTQFALSNPSGEPFEAVVSFPVGGQAITHDGTFTPPWAE